MTDYLDADALAELTGYRQRARQIAWLRYHRWRFAIRADGRILVARAYWQSRMVGDEAAPERPATVAEPDFAAVARGA